MRIHSGSDLECRIGHPDRWQVLLDCVVNVANTVQDKAVTFPTDPLLLHKARIALVRLTRRHGVKLRQSYAHARQMNRAAA